MRFIIDENIPSRILATLNRPGTDVIRVPKVTKDGVLGDIARQEHRIILTMDKDFMNPSLFPPQNFSGIICIRIHPPYAGHILPILEKLLSTYSAEEFDKKIISLKRDSWFVK